MADNKITQLLILLFKAKGKKIDNETKVIIKSWIFLCDKYGLNENDVSKGIDVLIRTKTPYGIEFADIYEIARPKMNYDEKAHEKWEVILKGCRGDSYERTDENKDAILIFNKISSFGEYGYSSDEFKKNRIRNEFFNLFKEKLKSNDAQPKNLELM